MEIDIDSPVPAYDQIALQIKQGILDGTLSTGDSLPAIRQLANDLELNPNTVAKAYKLLEIQRVIRTAGRKGTFVQRNAARYIVRNNSQEAQDQLDELVTSFQDRGISIAGICKLLENQLKLIAN
jgi:GntR family transcriptional regulator